MNAPQQRIHGLIVHKLVKERHERRAEVVTRPALIGINDPVERLVSDLHRSYSDKSGKGYGKFEADEDNYPMPRYARDYFVEQSIDFYEMSVRMMNTLRDRAQNEQLATGGYVLIAHVNNGSTDFLLVAIVTDRMGTAITDGLDIVDSPYIDLAALRVAGRIDVTAWQANSERYISFLKARGEVSDYFKHFLGCNDVVESSEETRKLIACLKSFATNQGLEAEDRDRLLRGAFDYCSECAAGNRPLSLDGLANRLMPDAPENLRAAFADGNLQLSDGFVPNRRALRSLVKFKAKTTAWAVEFDRDALVNGEIEFDEQNQTLVLHNLPDDLLHEMIVEKRNEPEAI
ncbi:Nucleoid-associated protein YejK [Caballeronia temeraria]|uniref:Nucleoid-associated protein YejK n=1 Tax=Caballeronia temeraria TaxID=1777137 RepID=A0A158DVB1_9BURK|nr:nucleoid-associated protein [Caballeronia temeraria]SAK98589.1 Nucleoid-associated protein YejK [Caballeronia temeraria]